MGSGSQAMGSGSQAMGSGSQAMGSGSQAMGSGSQAMGPGSAVFLWIRDWAVPFLWDQRLKYVTRLDSRIRKFGAKTGSAMKKH